jgi:hypothetical protein
VLYHLEEVSHERQEMTSNEIGREMARAAWSKANTARRLNKPSPSVRGMQQVMFRKQLDGKDEDGVPTKTQIREGMAAYREQWKELQK